MDKFKEVLKKRKNIMILFNTISIFFYAIGSIYGYFNTVSNDQISDFIRGFQVGIFIAMQTILVPLIIKYSKALKDNEKLKLLYIDENDERKKFIKSQIGGTGLNIALYGVGVASIMTGPNEFQIDK